MVQHCICIELKNCNVYVHSFAECGEVAAVQIPLDAIVCHGCGCEIKEKYIMRVS